MTFYDTVKKVGAGSLSVTIPKKWATYNKIEKGDYVLVDMKKQEIPKIDVENDN